MKAIYDPLKPHKEFVLPEDFEGFHPDEIEQIRKIQNNQIVRTDICLVRDSDKLKNILKRRLKKMGFKDEKGHFTHFRLERQTGIESKYLSAYFNHNRYILNEANGKYMPYISGTNLLILCLFAGVKLNLDIKLEPLEFEPLE